MHLYSKEEIEFLKDITPCRSNKEITEMFNKRFNLNITETAIAAIRKKHHILTGNTGQFKKGSIPANKGKKGIGKGGVETQFKKGNIPHNWVPIGTERITKDGYIQIKIQEGKLQRNWKGKHILIWEEHNGPVPRGFKVLFGDGNMRNFDIDNLILATDYQMLYLNSNDLIKNGAEITKVGIALAEISKKISERRNRNDSR